jgi:phosphoglycerate dehydrogenase-like enzyme
MSWSPARIERAFKLVSLFFVYSLGNSVCVVAPVLLSGTVISCIAEINAGKNLTFFLAFIIILVTTFFWKIYNSTWYVAPKPSPLVRSAAYFLGYTFSSLSVVQESRLADGLLILWLLYLGQLFYDRLETWLGGYLILVSKAAVYYSSRLQRHKAKRIDVPLNCSVMVVDVNDWYALTEDEMARIKNHFPEHLIVNNLYALNPADFASIDIIFGAPPRASLKKFTSLRWIHLPSSGINGYDQPELYAASPVVTSSVGVYGEPISEYALGLILMLAKRIDSGVINNKCGYGHDVQHASLDIGNCTVLVVGLGNIGTCIAKRCRALGASVLGVRRKIGDGCPEVDRCYTMDQLDEIIGEADVIVLALPENRETDNVINISRLGRMKRGVYLVNIGRGNAVNQRDLCKALRRGWVAGAALDVSNPDPLWPHNTLFQYRNLVLTLHHSSISGANGRRAVEVFLTTAQKVLQPKAYFDSQASKG